MSTRPALTGFETRLLAELRQVVTERATAAPHPATAPHRRLAMAGVLSAAVAAGLAVALTVTLPGSGGPPAGPAAPRFAPATTVAAVLDNAALAAQSEPAVTPRPDQFVYLKLLDVEPGTAESTESWASVSGTRKGLTMTIVHNGSQPAKKFRGFKRWCQDGFVDGLSNTGGSPGGHCTPQEYAAYKPWLPSTTAGMRAYLARTGRGTPGHFLGGNMLYLALGLLISTDLTPAQQAAMFHALAGVPHLHIVPKVADALGRTGVGIRLRGQEATTTTAIFDPRTFRLLGAAFTDRLGARRWALTVPATVVDRPGQRP